MNTYPDANKNDVSTESFEEYRRRAEEARESNGTSVKRKSFGMWIRAIFGVFLVLVYIGMGVLFIINFFEWPANWTWARWLIGVVLVAYGIFRGYRFYKGVDYSYE